MVNRNNSIVAVTSRRGGIMQAFRPGPQPGRRRPAASAPKRKQVRQNNNIQRMQYAQKAKKGTRVDPSERWGQTPATSNQLAPRGFGYYDAFAENAYSAITAMSIGPATPITAKCVAPTFVTQESKLLDGDVELEAGFIMIVVYPSSSNVLMRQYTCGGLPGPVDPTQVISVRDFTAPALTSDPPESAIPVRCSFTIKNISENFTMGGDIYTLRCTTGITQVPYLSTTLDLATFAQDIRVHARATSYDGAMLKNPHQKNCTIVDQSKATWFDNWDVLHSETDQPWLRQIIPSTTGPTFEIDAFTNGIHNPSFTPIVILLDPFLSGIATSASGARQGNTYRIIAQAQYLAHYPQGGMLANMAVEPKSSPSAMEKHRAYEESHGSLWHKVEPAARLIQQAWNHRQSIAAGVRVGARLLGY